MPGSLTPPERRMASRSTSPPVIAHSLQAVPAVTKAVVRPLIGTGDEPVERHGHVENGCRHAFPFLASGHTGRRPPEQRSPLPRVGRQPRAPLVLGPGLV